MDECGVGRDDDGEKDGWDEDEEGRISKEFGERPSEPIVCEKKSLRFVDEEHKPIQGAMIRNVAVVRWSSQHVKDRALELAVRKKKVVRHRCPCQEIRSHSNTCRKARISSHWTRGTKEKGRRGRGVDKSIGARKGTGPGFSLALSCRLVARKSHARIYSRIRIRDMTLGLVRNCRYSTTSSNNDRQRNCFFRCVSSAASFVLWR